jgi:hypothetical protein
MPFFGMALNHNLPFFLVTTFEKVHSFSVSS